MSKDRTTAFVLSGGASLGAIHVGMLRALYERGIAPAFVVATSAGALNGAFIASRPQTAETADDLGRIWRGIRRDQVFPLSPLKGLLGLLGSYNHLVSDSGLRGLVARHLAGGRLEQLPLPLHIVAVDPLTGQELLLSAGSLRKAVMASSSIPGVLPPVRWEGRDLIDGAVANDTPLSHAVELGADEIYVLSTGHACALEEPPRGALEMALHAVSLLVHRRLVRDLDDYAGKAHVVVLPPPCPLSITPIDFDHASELIQRAYTDACEFLDGGGAMRPPIRMHSHRHRTQEGADHRCAGP